MNQAWSEIQRVERRIEGLLSVSESDAGQWDIQGGDTLESKLKTLKREFESKYTVTA